MTCLVLQLYTYVWVFRCKRTFAVLYAFFFGQMCFLLESDAYFFLEPVAIFKENIWEMLFIMISIIKVMIVIAVELGQ